VDGSEAAAFAPEHPEPVGTQMVSALLRHGPNYLVTLRPELESWMQKHEWSSLGEMRGNMSLERIPDPAAYERANFRMALR
jgi:dihydroorotate dehydrogenase (fumarate)